MSVLRLVVHLLILPVVPPTLRQPDRIKGDIQSVGLGVILHDFVFSRTAAVGDLIRL
jgi:hypothetical protein